MISKMNLSEIESLVFHTMTLNVDCLDDLGRTVRPKVTVITDRFTLMPIAMKVVYEKMEKNKMKK